GGGVEKGTNATISEPRNQFVGERGRILAKIGDEALELFASARISHRLFDHIVYFRARAARSAQSRPRRRRWPVPAREPQADPPPNYGGPKKASRPLPARPEPTPPRGPP